LRYARVCGYMPEGLKAGLILLVRTTVYWVFLLGIVLAVSVLAPSMQLLVLFLVPLLAVGGLAYEVWQLPRESLWSL